MAQAKIQSLPNKLLRLLFEQSSDAIFLLNTHGELLAVNQTACDRFGYSKEELLQKQLPDLMAKEDTASYTDRLDLIIKNHRATFQVIYLHRNGQRIPFEIHSRLINWPDGDFILHICRDISERKLREMEYHSIIQAAGDGFFVLRTADAKFIDVNETYCHILGYTREELLGMHVYDVEALESQTATAERIDSIIKSGHQLFETQQYHKNGHRLDLEVNVSYAPVNGGTLFVFVREITLRKQQEAESKLASLIFKASTASIVVTDEHNNIIAINPAFTNITGYELHEVAGKNPRILQSRRQNRIFYQDMWKTLLRDDYWEGEWWSRNKDGNEFAEHVVLNIVRNPDGSIYRFVKISSDVTEQKKLQEHIWRQAHYDLITRLPNRQLFLAQLENELLLCHERNLRLALYFIDLDGFKNVNDEHGHDAGDQLLFQVGQRISGCIRGSDTVARLGGDEFTVMLSGLYDDERVTPVGQQILHVLAQPFSLAKATVTISASIGAAIFPDDAGELKTLLKLADQAMYSAKNAGKNDFHFAADISTQHHA
ncbi:MAG: PAS domain S-box protein [Thiohalomonadaceae bacterium]